MQLLLMRHGVAEDADDGTDRADARRRLTTKGKHRVEDMARLLKALGLRPSHYVSSPRTRALQTAEVIRDAIGGKEKVTQLSSLDFDGRWQDFVADIKQATKKDADAVVLATGHEPVCSEYVTQALLPVHATFPMKKGSVAVLEWKGSIADREAQLLLYATAKASKTIKPKSV